MANAPVFVAPFASPAAAAAALSSTCFRQQQQQQMPMPTPRPQPQFASQYALANQVHQQRFPSVSQSPPPALPLGAAASDAFSRNGGSGGGGSPSVRMSPPPAIATPEPQRPLAKRIAWMRPPTQVAPSPPPPATVFQSPDAANSRLPHWVRRPQQQSPPQQHPPPARPYSPFSSSTSPSSPTHHRPPPRQFSPFSSSPSPSPPSTPTQPMCHLATLVAPSPLPPPPRLDGGGGQDASSMAPDSVMVAPAQSSIEYVSRKYSLEFKGIVSAQGEYSRIRVWKSKKGLTFYDCTCGKRRPDQGLRKLLHHAARHSVLLHVCHVCGKTYRHHCSLNAHSRVHKHKRLPQRPAPPDKPQNSSDAT